MAEVGSLVVALTANMSDFNKGMGAAQQTIAGASGWGGLIAGGAMVGLTAVTAGAGVAAAAVGGIGLAALSTAMDADGAMKIFQRELGLTEEQAASAAGAAEELFRIGVTGSVTEAAGAIATISGSMENFTTLSEQGIGSVSATLVRLTEQFGVDLAEASGAAGTLMQEFGLSANEATGLLTTGLQSGLNSSGDFLDTLSEYGPQFAANGLTASEFYALLETGSQNGVLGTDKIADAFKEMFVILTEGNTTAIEGLAAMGLSYDDMAASVAAGQATWADYIPQILEGLGTIQDPLEKARLETALFGTMAEDLGAGFTSSLSTSTQSMTDMESNLGDFNDSFQTFGQFFTEVWNTALLAIAPVGDVILDLARDMMPWLRTSFDAMRGPLEGFAQGVADGIRSLLGLDGQSSASQGQMSVFGEIIGKVTEFVGDFVGWLVGKAIPAVSNFIQQAIIWSYPYLERLGEIYLEFINDYFPALQRLFGVLVDVMVLHVGPAIAGLWEALGDFAEMLGISEEGMGLVGVALEAIEWGYGMALFAVEALIVGVTILSTVFTVAVGIITGVVQIITAIGDAINGAIGWIRDMIRWVGKLISDLLGFPDWLIPHSPTDFEIGMRGINDAVRKLPDIGAKFDVGADPSSGPGPAGAMTGTIINVGGITVAEPDEIVSNLNLLRAIG